MLLLGPTIDEYIIQVDQDTPVQESYKHVVHNPLKRGGRVHEPKGYHTPLKGAIPTRERSFFLVCFSHANLVVPISKVQLR